MPIKKGDLVRLLREKFENSVEALASDRRLPAYVFDGTGEVVELSGNYAQIKFLVAMRSPLVKKIVSST